MTEKAKHQTIHIHHSRIKSSFQVLALLVPSIVFVFVLALLLRGYSTRQAAQVTDKVLGQDMPITKVVTIGTKEISVSIADTELKRQKGLGGVRSLPENQGVLFVFDEREYRTFWMKNMFIAIDIIWISDGKIVQINKSVPPPDPGTPDTSLKLYTSNQPVDYVLETGAGFSDKYGLEVGSEVDLSRAITNL